MKTTCLIPILAVASPFVVDAVEFAGGDGDGSANASFVGRMNGTGSIFGGGDGDGHSMVTSPPVSLGGSSLIDSDGDGMPDTWEVLNGLNPAIDDSDLDADSDGASNLNEYLFCTDPQNPDDATHLSIFVGAGASTVTISWPSVPGKTYLIETSENLRDWSPSFSVTGSPGATTATTIIVDDQTKYFLRLRVNE